MHVRSACDQWSLPGRCNACCVAEEFMRGVLHHPYDEAHPIVCRFCVQTSHGSGAFFRLHMRFLGVQRQPLLQMMNPLSQYPLRRARWSKITLFLVWKNHPSSLERVEKRWCVFRRHEEARHRH